MPIQKFLLSAKTSRDEALLDLKPGSFLCEYMPLLWFFRKQDQFLETLLWRDNLDENGVGNQSVKRRPVAKS
jgi:hypothetical protein